MGAKPQDPDFITDLRIKAEEGSAKAQYNLGVMYTEGEGVIKDYKQAFKWFTKSAEQGDSSAQYNLGLMYANGLGVIKDYRQAYMYANVSSYNGSKGAIKLRELMEKKLTAEQINETQELSREWIKSHK
ncbi:tetratricopeptide repeat protein [Bathymodiolus platifrons methanotrophic gill symbiont]|uniref:tetratricopeptide repeat protein n=1 Tax=Bathymodiolus platifrons methanotrophic gill symbiont TaxID=113268 RepID=UPI001C8E7ECC|nr:tetratricopeptide repeat protein [Bathymodiolus platifrons methanotrophic gill symbiont]